MQNISRIFKGIGEVSSGLETVPGLICIAIVFLCAVALVVSWIVVPGLKWRSSTKQKFRVISAWVAIAIYFILVLAFTYIVRDPSQGYQIRLLPLYGLKDTAVLGKELLGDLGSIVLFVPLGILFFSQCYNARPLVQTLMFSFGFGLLTEVLQYIFKMGTFSLEDMICAAVGGTLGGALALLWQKTQGKKSVGGVLLRVAFGLCLLVVILGSAVFGTYHFLRIGGEKSIQNNISTVAMDMESGNEKKDGNGNLIWHNGSAYRYNDQVITLLCMGIDQHSEEIQEYKNISGESGQADSIFLAVLDPANNKLSVIAVSRDTMTEIATYDAKGNYIGDSLNHLGLEYAFGDGKETSCQYMVDAVSKLFYGIPINGYVAFNMSTISQLNDAVGGVTVTVPEDENISKELQAGETVTLKGDMAESFVRYRDNEAVGSNNQRIERQKQFLINFFSKAVEAVQADVTLPVTLYQDFSKEMVTNVGLDNAVYLITEATRMKFGEDSLMVLQGETKAGKSYDEVYVDEEALYELILKTFYTEVSLG